MYKDSMATAESSLLNYELEILELLPAETQFLESQVLFRQASGTLAAGGLLSETVYDQKPNKFTSEGFIGDARLLSEDTNVAPAWKVFFCLIMFRLTFSLRIWCRPPAPQVSFKLSKTTIPLSNQLMATSGATFRLPPSFAAKIAADLST